MCNCIVPLQKILTHLLKPCLLHLYIQRRLLKNLISLPLCLPPSDISGYPVLKPPQGPAHAGGHHPRLRPPKKYRLHNFLKKYPQHPWALPLPSQYPCYMGPYILGLTEVTHHFRIIVVRCCYDPPQVFEGCYRLDRPTVILKGPHCAIPHLLCQQTTSFTLHSLVTLGSGNMLPV